MNRASRPWWALLVALPLLAGCTARSEACVSTGPDDYTGQELKVLDHGAFDLAFAFLEPLFENRTGARLTQIVGEDAGEALRQAIDSKGNPVADVIYGVDNALFFRAARAGILEPYASPRLAALDLPRSGLDDFRMNGLLLATPADQGFISVNYDVKLTAQYRADELPDSLADLAEPAWANRFAVEDPRFSSPGLGFLIATVATFGENDDYDYLDYWKDLFDRGVYVAKDWTDAYVVHFSAGYGQYDKDRFVGDKPLVVSYTTSPAVEAFYGDGRPPSVSLEPRHGVFHQIETVAILKCTRQLPLAQAFVDFVLGPEFQNQTSETMAVYPVTRGAQVIPNFHTNATDPADLEPVPFSSAHLDAGIPRWVDAWTRLFQQSRA